MQDTTTRLGITAGDAGAAYAGWRYTYLEGFPMKLCALMVLTLAGCTLGACGAPTHVDTPSAHPEVTISRVTPDKVKPVLVSKMTDKGYRVAQDTEFNLAFDKSASKVFFQEGGTADRNQRVTYSIAQVGDDVRVVADISVITNPGTGHEERTDVNDAANAPAHEIQSFLDDLRTELNSAQTSANKPSQKKPARPPLLPGAKP
jgi:hypothetical protein